MKNVVEVPLSLSEYVQLLSHIWFFAASWTVAHQAPLSTEFSKQEYWERVTISFSGDLPKPGIEPASPALASGFFTTEPSRKPFRILKFINNWVMFIG